jgi:hypothetical protein
MGTERLFAWLFHLGGHPSAPLYTAQLFTVEYLQGDRGICVRVTREGTPMDLHRFWDGVITSGSNLTRLDNQSVIREELETDGWPPPELQEH